MRRSRLRHDDRHVHGTEQVRQIVVEAWPAGLLLLSNSALMVLELFVGRLEFLFGGLQFLVGALQLFVGGLCFLVGGAQLLDDGLQILAGGNQFPLSS